jgi:hypothetical protein
MPAIPAALLLLALSAGAVADVFVEANPSTVEAGSEVSIRASCPDNTVEASVDSPAFGTVTVRPEFGFLTASATVPADRAAGSYDVRLQCPGGTSSRTTLNVVNRNRPSRGPATGLGGTAGTDPSRWLIVGGLVAIGLAAALGILARRRV